MQPEKLAATLNALATALDGRGTRIGQNIVLVDSYFTELNRKRPPSGLLPQHARSRPEHGTSPT